MPWNKVEDIAPPTDRVIEVTSGAAWTYEDSFLDATHRHRPNTTARHWTYQGDVALVLWYSAEALGAKQGSFLSTKGGMMPPFTFWREYENPLAGLEGYITDTTPHRPINERFDGDARLRLYPDIEAAANKNIAWLQDVIGRDVAAGRPPLPSSERGLRLGIEHANKVTADKAAAYDPYELPENVRGKAKSG